MAAAGHAESRRKGEAMNTNDLQERAMALADGIWKGHTVSPAPTSEIPHDTTPASSHINGCVRQQTEEPRRDGDDDTCR